MKKRIKKTFLNFILTALAFILTGLGTSMSIKAAIGISSFNAMNVSLSEMLHIKVGTITTFVNLFFLFLYIVITKGKYKVKYVLQFLGVSFIGAVINFFTYTYFDKMIVSSYAVAFILLAVGVIISAVSIGFLLSLDTISFPVEAFCLAYAEKFNNTFAKIRRYVDIFSVSISLLISYIFAFPLAIREGTVLSFLLFATTIGYSHKFFEQFESLKKIKIFV